MSPTGPYSTVSHAYARMGLALFVFVAGMGATLANLVIMGYLDAWATGWAFLALLFGAMLGYAGGVVDTE